MSIEQDTVEIYRDYRIYGNTYKHNYGAWFMFHNYAFVHLNAPEEEPDEHMYGSAKTIEDCRKQIDEKIKQF